MPQTEHPSPSVAVDGAVIRARRVELGENLQVFARRVPMSFTYLSDLELGRRARMSPGLFVRLREALGVPAERANELKPAVPATPKRRSKAAA